MTSPRAFAGYAFDLDGTVYIGDDPLPLAAETIRALRNSGARVVFVTNKPLHTATEYAAKLTSLGIPATSDEIVTALDALVVYLRERHAGRSVLLISEGVVRERLEAEGFAVVTDPDLADVVVVAFDRTFTYAKLHAGFRAVRERSAAIVATNPDPYCPTPEGGLPDCAAMLAALEACTGARAEAVVGKPSPYMATAVLDRLGLAAKDVAIVGDRLGTDIAMGQAIGATAVLVLTGATSAADLARDSVEPDVVLDGLHQLLTPPPRGAAT